MKYYRSRPDVAVDEAVQHAIALAQGMGDLVELEHEGRRVIDSPTHVGQVCHDCMTMKV